MIADPINANADASLPPHSMECENGLIAATIGNRDGIAEAYALGIRDDAFFSLPHRHVWQAITELEAQGAPVEIVAIAQRLREQGRLDGVTASVSLFALANDAVPGMLQWFVQGILKAWELRRVIRASQNAVAVAMRANADPSQIVLELENELEAAKHHSQASTRTAKQVCRSWIDRVQQRQADRAAGTTLSGIPTGFAKLDAMSSGLMPGTMTVIGARPSVGKTAMLCNLVRSAGIDGQIPTTVVSLETMHETLMDRIASDVCRIDGWKLRDGIQLGDEEQRRLVVFAAKASAAPVTWSVDVFDCAGICSMIGRHADAGTKLFLIDYLQIVNPGGTHDRRAYSVGSVATALKQASLRHKVAVVVLAQLKRTDTDESLPTANDLADSDQIFRDADLLWLLHRPDRFDEPTKGSVVVAKNKEGETAIVPMHYDPSNFRWTENIPSKIDHDAR